MKISITIHAETDDDAKYVAELTAGLHKYIEATGANGGAAPTVRKGPGRPAGSRNAAPAAAPTEEEELFGTDDGEGDEGGTDDDETDPFSDAGEDEPPPPKPGQKPKTSDLTDEALKKKSADWAEKNGGDQFRAILKTYGAKRISEIPEGSRAKFWMELNKPVKKA